MTSAQSSLPPQAAAASAAAVESALEHLAEKNKDQANNEEPKTVFHNPENFTVKHPLYNRWTLWFDNPSAKSSAPAKGTKDTWNQDLHKVVTIDSVEEFWGLYSHIIPPSDLPAKANYYLFKEGIQPAWEDPRNTNGGKWSVQFPREKSRSTIDRTWLYTMLSAIGETLEASFPAGVPDPTEDEEISEMVTGVLLAARPNFYRIAIWTRKSNDGTPSEALQTRLMDIGKHFKVNVVDKPVDQKLNLGGLGTEVEFQSHKESQNKRGKKTIL